MMAKQDQFYPGQPKHELGCQNKRTMRTSVHRVYLALLALAILCVQACSQPSNYDDCILKYVKNGMDRTAVAAIMRSCKVKFPSGSNSQSQTLDNRALAGSELNLLTGRAGLVGGRFYSVSLYNGNTNLTVTEVEITVTTTIAGELTTRAYRDEVSIPPQTVRSCNFDIIRGDDSAKYNWFVSSALGRQHR